MSSIEPDSGSSGVSFGVSGSGIGSGSISP